MSKLQQDYIQLHNEGKFPGTTVLLYKDVIGNILKYHNAKTIIDMGCGKAKPYFVDKIDEEWNVDATLYDPFFEQLNKLDVGKQHDVVLSIDVIEHIPEEEIDSWLELLFALALKAVVVTFCNRPAKKTLPISGGNAHILQRDRDWWENRLAKARYKVNPKVVFYLMENVS